MTVGWFIFESENRAVYHLPGDFSGLKEGEKLLDGVDTLYEKGVRRFEVDFALARYISSLGIALLIKLKRKLVASNADLVLLQVSKDVRRVFTITRTESFLMPGSAPQESS